MSEILGNWSFENGYASAIARANNLRVMAAGSKNALSNGTPRARNFRGCTIVAAETGSRQHFLTDNNYAGLGDAAQPGAGSVFKAKNVLAFIGTGKVRFNGADTTAIASSSLSYQRKSSGVYGGTVYQAGHAQPGAPIIYGKSPVGAGKSPMSGVVAVVVWRVDSITGQVSLMSLPSNSITLSDQSVIVKINSLADANGQDFWGLGVTKPGFGDFPVFYQLPTNLGGEVSESYLAFSRTVANATVANNSKVVTFTGGDLSAADIGRRITIGAFDSWIEAITSPSEIVAHDQNTSGAAQSGTALIKHAINGFLRSVEISWTVEALVASDAKLAPDKAYPPPAGKFAGMQKDTVWLETADGIVYVGVPGFIGSFPPSRAMFPSDPAVLYLDAGDNVAWRFTRNGLTVLSYVGGENPLELQTVWKGFGILDPQNACVGYQNRIVMFAGKPMIYGGGAEPQEAPNLSLVAPDFAGWENQTASEPVVTAFDPNNYFEIWGKNKKLMCLHAPSGAWCAPIDLTQHITGSLVSAVIVNQQLRLCASDGTVIREYLFDVGTGSRAVYQTAEHASRRQTDTIRMLEIVPRADNQTPITVELLVDYNQSVPARTYSIVPTNQTGLTKIARKKRPNVRRARVHSVRVTIDSSGGDAGIDKIETIGESSDLFVG